MYVLNIKIKPEMLLNFLSIFFQAKGYLNFTWARMKYKKVFPSL